MSQIINDRGSESILNETHQQHRKTNSISVNNLNHQQVSHQPSSIVDDSNRVQNVNRPSHQRTRSVDLRLTYSSSNSSGSNSSNLSSRISDDKNCQVRWLASIEEKVSKLYYKHGLFCSRHPALIITISLVVVAISSYQIFTFHGLFGSSYDVYISSQDSKNYNSDIESNYPFMKHLNFWPDSYVRNELENDQNIPPWFQPNLSFAYVQQIYIRSAVIPWNEQMQLVDAFRGPFGLIFEFIESISNFQYKNDFGEEMTLNDICFQVFEPVLSKKYVQITTHLPSFSCLLLSPANVWHGDQIEFQQDSNLLTTLLKLQDLPSTPLPSGALHDILFGVSFEETGIRRTYGRNRVRTITYSITLILKKNIPRFNDALKTFLKKRYPISVNNNEKNDRIDSYNESVDRPESFEYSDFNIKHIYFHNTFTYNYLLPLILLYIILCLYMYFSVRKMEIIRNKRLYSLCTLATIIMSLFMSFGICFRLRFHSVLIVNRLLPYFVAGMSFENMLVLTKSVLANPHLDSKVRVAQALSKEGLSITKNLLTELILLSIGSFTLIPFLQEFCKIAAICFLSDFFIQITFFTPFFSLLTQRINERSIRTNKLDKNFHHTSYPRNIYARPGEPVKQKTPKRLRFIYFLAQLRLVQRCFILMLSACICLAIYNAYLVLEQQSYSTLEHPVLFTKPANQSLKETREEITTMLPLEHTNNHQQHTRDFPDASKKQRSFMKLLETKENDVSDSKSFPSKNDKSDKIESKDPYYRIYYTPENPLPKPLANHHWTNLFSLYNISLVGRFISILPPILLSVSISPDRAKHLRNAADSDYYTLKKFIPVKFTNGEYVISDDDDYDNFERRSHWFEDDLRLIIGLWIPSLLLFIYLIVQLYRCICSRNYAEWRSQLSSTNPLKRLGSFVKSAALNSRETKGEEKLLRIDISMLNYDRQKDEFQNEMRQDIDLISTNVQTSLIVASLISGDIQCYDALTYESKPTIKRSQTNTSSDFLVYKRTQLLDEQDSQEESDSRIMPILVSSSQGDTLRTMFTGISDISNENDNLNQTMLDFRPIWCMEIFERYVLVGCGGDDGRLEVWNAHNGQLAFVYHSETYKNGYEINKKNPMSHAITAMKVIYCGVALARINGQLEMLEIEQVKEDKHTISSLSGSHLSVTTKTNKIDRLRYRCKHHIQAHRQPITRLEIIDSLEDEEFIRIFGSGCLITGSLDNTLKVYALDKLRLIYTLNGHCGSIKTTCIDPYSTASALSGCQLGQLCVWDLNTGTCIFSMQAHADAEVLSITTSPLYYVTNGTDNNICIWDRYSGHLIHTIPNQHTFCKNMIFLEPYILVTARDNELVIWDCNDARSICLVPLANHYFGESHNTNQLQPSQSKWTKSYQTTLINNLMFSFQRKALICDYGNSVCIINNPFEMKKLD